MKNMEKTKLEVLIKNEYFYANIDGRDVDITEEWIERNEALYSFSFDTETYRKEYIYLGTKNMDVILRTGWRIPVRIFAGTYCGSEGNTFFLCSKFGGEILIYKMREIDLKYLQLFAVSRSDMNKVSHIAKYRNNLKVLKSYKFTKEEVGKMRNRLLEVFGSSYSFNFVCKSRLSLRNDVYHSGDRTFYPYGDFEGYSLGAEIELCYENEKEMDVVNVALNRPRNARAWLRKFKSEQDSSLRGDYTFEIINIGYGGYKDFIQDNKEMLSVAFAGKIDDPSRSCAGLHFHVGNFTNREHCEYFAQLLNIIINSKSDSEIIEIFGRNYNSFCEKNTFPTSRGSVYLSRYNTVEIRLFAGATSLQDFKQKYNTVCKLIKQTDKMLHSFSFEKAEKKQRKPKNSINL